MLSVETTRRLRFGVFEVDLKNKELRRAGVRVRLQGQPFKVLAALLERAGEVVSREELQKLLWGADTTVDFDHSLGIAINKLRDALGDSADNPRFVETLARQGYRFIAPISVVNPEPTASPVVPVEPLPQAAAVPVTSHARFWRIAAVALGCISVALVAAQFFRVPLRRPYHVSQVTFSPRVMTNDLEVESFSTSVNDGTRLYFSLLDNGNPVLAEALTANGEISAFHLPSEIGAPLIGALSPDGSKLVLRSYLEATPEQPLWIVPTLGGDARRVPNVRAHDATWMPDGNQLLVASGNELTVMNEDASDPRPLLTTPGRAFWMRWSPDGRKLRFTLRDPKRQISELWEANADGSNPHPLLPDWSHPASECCGSWTSDGKFFVFQSAHNGHSDVWARREKPWLRDSKVWEITSGPLAYQAPTVAPGSHRVFFIGANTQIELLRATPKSSAFAALDSHLSSAALAEYSLDGKWVAWQNASDGSLWRSRADGSERIELTTPPLRIFTMKWSADDRRLALMANEPGKPWKIYLVDAEGGKPTPILDQDRNEADPNWSADGQTIVFGRLPDRMDSVGPKAIYSYDMKSRQLNQIPGSDGLFSPRLSPDGRYIAAMRMDQRALVLFDRQQQHWTTLSDHSVGDPTWSHDSRYVYFQDFLEAGKPIYRLEIPGGHLERVAVMSDLRPIDVADYRLIGLAPGDLPIVSAKTSTVNLYTVNLDER